MQHHSGLQLFSDGAIQVRFRPYQHLIVRLSASMSVHILRLCDVTGHLLNEGSEITTVRGLASVLLSPNETLFISS